MTRHRWLLMALTTIAAVLIAAPAASGDAVERVTNGGFESGSSPWTLTNSFVCQLATCGLSPASGANYGTIGPKFSGAAAPPSAAITVGTISQSLNLPESPATISMRLRRTNFDPPTGGWDALFDVYYNGVLVKEIVNGDIAADTFVKVSVPTPVGFAATGTLELTVTCVNNNPSTVHCSRYDVDDVSVITGSVPAAPTLTSTDPASPGSSLNPKIRGNLGAGSPSQVKVFTNTSCSGAPAAAGSAADFTSAGIPVTVAQGSTTSFSASASNLAGDSFCSNSISYVHQPPDTKPPQTKLVGGPKKKTTRKRATFKFSSNEPGSTFECRVDKQDPFDCESPLSVKVKKGKHTFSVAATDAAGNEDSSPATMTWKVVKAVKKRPLTS